MSMPKEPGILEQMIGKRPLEKMLGKTPISTTAKVIAGAIKGAVDGAKKAAGK